MSTMTFGVDLTPNGDGQKTLGDSNHKWNVVAKDVTVSGALSVGGSAALTQSDIANDLTTTAADRVLGASQGKALKDAVDAKVNISDIVNDLNANTPGKVLDAYQGKVLIDNLIKVFEIPYSSFTWNSNVSSFVCESTNLPALTPQTDHIKAISVMPTNGNALMGGYMNSTRTLYISGWVPMTGQSINSAYEFKCYLLYQ